MTPQIRTAGPSAIKILASHSSFTVLDALAPAFERASGQQYAVEADGAKAMFARIKGGETADVVVLGPAEVGELEALGIIAAGVFAASKQPAAAYALIQFLLATTNAGVFREKGLEPI